MSSGNVFADLTPTTPEETFAQLFGAENVRIERIVSHGQASPAGFWYDQDHAEWVMVLSGSAGLRIEGEAAERNLAPGDYLLLDAYVRHRVEWTDSTQPTVWLAVHVGRAAKP